eukprot:scaffold11166_cov48-Attheya_sp.AAC.4
MILKELAEGTLSDHMIWVFTDNVTASICWNKGRSKAKQLLDICLTLKIAAREAGAFIKFVHILLGLRMIQTGYDGGSWGDYDMGGFAGGDHLEFVPLHKSALEWGGETLKQSLRLRLGEDYQEPLSPEGWFTTGHTGPYHLWAPPPAAALTALEQISEAKHKRPYATKHIVVMPWLLYYEEWRRRFEKEVDFWVMIPTGNYWPHSCFEPLLLGLSFPMRRESPWLLRRHAGLVGFQRKVQEMFRDSDVGVWSVLCKFWVDPWAVKEPQDFDRTTLAGPEDKGRFVEARAGDHIICPFQCDLCHIRNMKQREPRGIQDEATAALVRQANLDAFWSRAKGTVAKHRTEVRFQLKYAAELDFDAFPALGPYALGDDMGVRQAVGLLRRTKEPGLKKGSTIKYSTAWGVRSTHSEVWKASPDSGLGLVFTGERKRYTATMNPTEGIWFNKFMDGLDIRMADITKQDRAFSLGIMHALMNKFEADWKEKGTDMDIDEIWPPSFRQ